MKNRYILIPAISLLLGCGGNEENLSNEETVGEVVEKCIYTYNHESTVLTWTAFKLSEKIGVSGTFDQVNVTANEPDNDAFKVLVGATFEIPTTTVNTQDPERDGKLKDSFFGKLDTSMTISGTVVELNTERALIEIVMNGKSVQYEGSVTRENQAK